MSNASNIIGSDKIIPAATIKIGFSMQEKRNMIENQSAKNGLLPYNKFAESNPDFMKFKTKREKSLQSDSKDSRCQEPRHNILVENHSVSQCYKTNPNPRMFFFFMTSTLIIIYFLILTKCFR